MDCRDSGALGMVPVRAKVCAWASALLPDMMGAQRREDDPLKLKGTALHGSAQQFLLLAR